MENKERQPLNFADLGLAKRAFIEAFSEDGQLKPSLPEEVSDKLDEVNFAFNLLVHQMQFAEDKGGAV